MLAFGIAAPFESFTVPDIRPKTVCPYMLRLPQTISKRTAMAIVAVKPLDPEFFVLNISLTSTMRNAKPWMAHHVEARAHSRETNFALCSLQERSLCGFKTLRQRAARRRSVQR